MKSVSLQKHLPKNGKFLLSKLIQTNRMDVSQFPIHKINYSITVFHKDELKITHQKNN